jgi:hypothetical protein
MKTLKLTLICFMILVFQSDAVIAQHAQTSPENTTGNTKVQKSLRNSFPQISISPYAGVIFPLPKILSQNFKPGANINLDLGFRANREVGFYLKGGYYIMNSKISGAPIGTYLEISAGPRYYLTKPHLKSDLFFETGIGAYSFRQKSYATPGEINGSVIEQINNTKAGINGGIGSDLALTDAFSIMVKSKYHVIFTPNGTTSFITVGGGVSIKFR